MRIEGEKGVKTQSAPNIGRGRAKVNFGRAIPIGPTVRSSREGSVLGRIIYRATETVPRHARTGKEQAAIGRNFVSERTDRAGRSGKQRSASAEISRQTNLADQIARPRQNRPSAKTFLGQGKSPFH
ncbi:unnamed protein product [Microthlaspi erraticum]|uniref:Uncharacterized protein n=1 Tax=Microthlaspi erraticum TaxID=1685480 RepID=A0A6D2L7X8_9BRAS|nr:unnamed protein product [Microthlaspi erraticum]